MSANSKSHTLLWDRVVTKELPIGFFDPIGPPRSREMLRELCSWLLAHARAAEVFEATDPLKWAPNFDDESCVQCVPPFDSVWVEADPEAFGEHTAEAVHLIRSLGGGCRLRTGHVVVDFGFGARGLPREIGDGFVALASKKPASERHYIVAEIVEMTDAASLSPAVYLVSLSADGSVYESRAYVIGCDSDVKRMVGLYGSHRAPFVLFSLMNCRNVVTQDVQRRSNQSIRLQRRLGVPCDRYKTLGIRVGDIVRPFRFDPAAGDGQGKTQALHRVRGHFKTYTAERPLLGKFTGRYFWHPHLRGDEAAGRVHKTYQVMKDDKSAEVDGQ